VKRIATGGGRGHSDPAGRRPHARSFRKCTSDPFATVFTPLKSASEAKGHARIATEVKGGAPGGESRRSGIPVFRAVGRASADGLVTLKPGMQPGAAFTHARARPRRGRSCRGSALGPAFRGCASSSPRRRSSQGVDDLDSTLTALAAQASSPSAPPYTVREGWSRLSFVRDRIVSFESLS
jgi:hypothetical protein